MFRIYSTLIEIIAAAFFVIPIMIVQDRIFFHNKKRTVIYIIFGLYVVAILALVGFPNMRSRNIDFSINVIPFIDMASDSVNACLNVLLFVPYGFLLPVLWSKFRSVKECAIIGLVTSCIIEISQIFTFRTTDINDLITNTIGAVLGYYIAQYMTIKFTKHMIHDSKDRDFYIICASIVFIMFFLQPFISFRLWEMMLR